MLFSGRAIFEIKDLIRKGRLTSTGLNSTESIRKQKFPDLYFQQPLDHFDPLIQVSAKYCKCVFVQVCAVKIVLLLHSQTQPCITEFI